MRDTKCLGIYVCTNTSFPTKLFDNQLSVQTLLIQGGEDT